MTPWLTLVGIGEDGVPGLGESARQAIGEADLVFGGVRHLSLAKPLITGESQAWRTPFNMSIEAVLSSRHRQVCVLASGDPFHFGIGATLARMVPADEMRSFPAPSAFSLAASRLAWPLQDCVTLSLHGRPIDLIRPHLHAGARILALTSDAEGPGLLAQLLTATGFGASRLTVLEALGGAAERITTSCADSFALAGIDSLNLCAIDVVADKGARQLALAPGLPDDWFAHDGQITKREIRALALSSLAPRRGDLLWDIGAGSGSISVEWMLADPTLRAIAIEADATRAARICENAQSFGVPDLRIVQGSAPAALDGLPAPHAIFIGGGGSQAGVMEAAMAALRPEGRLVANAVTTEMESLLLDLHRLRGGTLTRIEVARAAPVGGMTGWRPAMPITQWAWTKPEPTT